MAAMVSLCLGEPSCIVVARVLCGPVDFASCKLAQDMAREVNCGWRLGACKQGGAGRDAV